VAPEISLATLPTPSMKALTNSLSMIRRFYGITLQELATKCRVEREFLNHALLGERYLSTNRENLNELYTPSFILSERLFWDILKVLPLNHSERDFLLEYYHLCLRFEQKNEAECKNLIERHPDIVGIAQLLSGLIDINSGNPGDISRISYFVTLLFSDAAFAHRLYAVDKQACIGLMSQAISNKWTIGEAVAAIFLTNILHKLTEKADDPLIKLSVLPVRMLSLYNAKQPQKAIRLYREAGTELTEFNKSYIKARFLWHVHMCAVNISKDDPNISLKEHTQMFEDYLRTSDLTPLPDKDITKGLYFLNSQMLYKRVSLKKRNKTTFKRSEQTIVDRIITSNQGFKYTSTYQLPHALFLRNLAEYFFITNDIENAIKNLEVAEQIAQMEGAQEYIQKLAKMRAGMGIGR